MIGIIHAVSILMSFMRFTRVTASLYDPASTKTIKIINSDGSTTEVPYVAGFQDVVPSLISAIMFVVSLGSVVCLFWGICKSRPKFLLPELVLLVASMVFCALAILFFILVLSLDSNDLNIYIKEQLQATGNDDLPDTIRFIAKIVAGVGIAVYLGAMALTYWFYRVVRNCYRYLQDKQRFVNEGGAAGARYAVSGSGEPGTIGERQPIVIIQPPSSGGGGGDISPPPAYSEKY